MRGDAPFFLGNHTLQRRASPTAQPTHVLGLDVAMNDALGVALRHRAQHSAQEGGGGALAVLLTGGRHQLATGAQLQHLAGAEDRGKGQQGGATRRQR